MIRFCCARGCSSGQPIRDTTTTTDHEYGSSRCRRAFCRPGMITGHNASDLACSRRLSVDRQVAPRPTSTSSRTSSADGQSRPEGIESSLRTSHGCSRYLIGTSEPRGEQRSPLSSRRTRAWQASSMPWLPAILESGKLKIWLFSLYNTPPANFPIGPTKRFFFIK